MHCCCGFIVRPTQINLRHFNTLEQLIVLTTLRLWAKEAVQSLVIAWPEIFQVWFLSCSQNTLPEHRRRVILFPSVVY